MPRSVIVTAVERTAVERTGLEPTGLDGARVLVTGSAGRIGTATAERLRAAGATVVGFDRPEHDIRDPDDVAAAMVGIDLVVHLGAIPGPGIRPWPETFGTNVTGTFTVLHAAGEAGVRRAVIASSINASGVPFHHDPTVDVGWYPFGVDVPVAIEDPYSLSKCVDEQTARMAHAHWGIDVLAVRFPLTASGDHLRGQSEKLTADPAPSVKEGWTYLDLRDAARVVELGLTRPFVGVPVVFVCAEDTLLPYPTEELLDRYAPSVPRLRTFIGREAPVDLAPARTLLGFTAEHRLDLPLRPLPADLST